MFSFKIKLINFVFFNKIQNRKIWNKLKKFEKGSTVFIYNFFAHSREIWGKSDNYVDLSPTPIPAHFGGGNKIFSFKKMEILHTV